MNMSKKTLKTFIFISIVACASTRVFAKPLYKAGNVEVGLSGMVRHESEFDIFTTLLRSSIHDKLFYTRTTMDLNFTLDSPCTTSQITLRDRLMWGNKRIVTTDRKYLGVLDAFPTVHAHAINPNMIWVREAWVQADVSKLFHTDLPTQTITVGSFSFKLGRGIALGDAYRVNSLSIDYFQDSVVDQYTWGIKYSGQCSQKAFQYELYLTILNNLTTGLEETNFPSRLPVFGGSNQSKVRGAGKINYIAAAHCLFAPLQSETQKLTFDPYVMHFFDPEQKVEYLFDAKTDLTTIGFAVEFMAGPFEFGFDCASNLGHQYVRGWDRNMVVSVNNGGYNSFCYSEVVTVNPLVQQPTDADIALCNPQNKAEVTAITTVPAGSLSNGAPIPGTPYYNSLNRYRDPYTTLLKGYMWVGDATVWLIPKTCALSLTWGLASGDSNPNSNVLDVENDSSDGSYNGFVPLQEMYSGNRVKSYFYMASGLVPLLSSANIDSYFSYGIDTLSNVIFWGSSFKYQGISGGKRWSVMPNMLMYWSDFRTNHFDITKGAVSEERSSPYKGLEANVFISAELSSSINLGVGLAMFVPGTFFADNQGQPFSIAASKELIRALKAGVSASQLPLLGDNTICSGTVALTYLF